MAFKATTNAFGSKPCLIFQGDLFETDPVFQAVKSIFVDIFRGDVVTNLSIEGLDHVISVTAIEGGLLTLPRLRTQLSPAGRCLSMAATTHALLPHIRCLSHWGAPASCGTRVNVPVLTLLYRSNTSRAGTSPPKIIKNDRPCTDTPRPTLAPSRADMTC